MQFDNCGRGILPSCEVRNGHNLRICQVDNRHERRHSSEGSKQVKGNSKLPVILPRTATLKAEPMVSRKAMWSKEAVLLPLLLLLAQAFGTSNVVPLSHGRRVLSMVAWALGLGWAMKIASSSSSNVSRGGACSSSCSGSSPLIDEVWSTSIDYCDTDDGSILPAIRLGCYYSCGAAATTRSRHPLCSHNCGHHRAGSMREWVFLSRHSSLSMCS